MTEPLNKTESALLHDLRHLRDTLERGDRLEDVYDVTHVCLTGETCLRIKPESHEKTENPS